MIAPNVMCFRLGILKELIVFISFSVVEMTNGLICNVYIIGLDSKRVLGVKSSSAKNIEQIVAKYASSKTSAVKRFWSTQGQ
jgi:hypothetical protein